MMRSIDSVVKEFSSFVYRGEDISGERETDLLNVVGIDAPLFLNQFWTSRQRQASSLHEISYRACFKPQLPEFFIARLTVEGDMVYDPFSGRGTTPIQATLMGRGVIANDINPLSRILTSGRLNPPKIEEVRDRLQMMNLEEGGGSDMDLSMFYHEKTEEQISSLRGILLEKESSQTLDNVDRWIRMVATNRLTGHSPGFFSVYTLPPNQALTPQRQIKINRKRDQKPQYRDVVQIILKKSRRLLRDVSDSERANLRMASDRALLLSKDASFTEEIEGESVTLTVTSPPFLNVVQYSVDNWLRCWFNGLDAGKIENTMTHPSSLKEWEIYMGKVFRELFRITRRGGWVAFEVGEVKNGKIRLDESVIPLGIDAGFECAGVLINSHDFTKTANIWGVSNNTRGTNTNRVVMFRKEN